MRVVGPYNESLLQCIAEEEIITIEDLKKKYLPPEQPGIVQGITVMFDNDLKVLEKLGYITIKDNIVKNVHR